jgi:hypothetical protein
MGKKSAAAGGSGKKSKGGEGGGGSGSLHNAVITKKAIFTLDLHPSAVADASIGAKSLLDSMLMVRALPWPSAFASQNTKR